MRLPRTPEYALRAMAYLATLPVGEAVPSQRLSEETGIPVSYLSKILRKLVVAELLTSQKGHGGGFVLARPSGSIHVREVLDAVDYEEDPERCAFGWDSCDPDHPCPLHPAWSVLKSSFQTWAGETTLASAVDFGPRPER